MLQPLSKKTIVEDIISVILDMAAQEQFKVGERLPSERDLAEQLHVSRTSVREALKALSFTGVVTVKPGDGTYLNEVPLHVQALNQQGNPFSLLKYRSDFKQISEARRILEVEMAVLASKRATAEAISEMEKCIKRMEVSLLEKGLLDDYVLEDIYFHDLLAKSCQNDILYQSLNTISQQIKEIIIQPSTIPGRAEDSLRQHKAILAAVKHGNIDEIRRLMEHHMDYSEENINMYFDLLTKEKEGKGI